MAKRKKHEARLTGAQLRAARALLELSAEDLADETKLSLKTIRRAEQVHGAVPVHAANAERIIEALEARGVIFIGTEVDGVGVRLRTEPEPRFGN